MDIVINRCYGGFNLSHKAVMRYAELKGITLFTFTEYGREFIPYTGTDESDPLCKSSPLFFYFTSPDHNDDSYFNYRELPRNDPLLVRTIRELGYNADGRCADLKIVSIPDDVEWEIEEYDGMEWVAEKHRIWK